MLSCLKKLVFLTIVFSIVAFAVNFWLSKKDFIFKVSDVQKIGKKYVDHKGSVEQMVEDMRADFSKLHPKDILPKQDIEQLFFGLGGFKGVVYIYHASLTEFLLIFGTPIQTSGNSVRQWVNRTDIILTGKSKLLKEGSTTAVTHVPGSIVYHEWGSEAVVEYGAGMWKLSYGRGFTLGSMPHYIATVLFHSQDYTTFFRMMVVYGKSMYQSILSHCPIFRNI